MPDLRKSKEVCRWCGEHKTTWVGHTRTDGDITITLLDRTLCEPCHFGFIRWVNIASVSLFAGLVLAYVLEAIANA